MQRRQRLFPQARLTQRPHSRDEGSNSRRSLVAKRRRPAPGRVPLGEDPREESRPVGTDGDGVRGVWSCRPSFLNIFPRTPMMMLQPVHPSHHTQQQPAERSKQQAGESRISNSGGPHRRGLGGRPCSPLSSSTTAHHPAPHKARLDPIPPTKRRLASLSPVCVSIQTSIHGTSSSRLQQQSAVSRQPRELCTCRRLKSGVWGNGVIGAAVLDDLHLSIEKIAGKRDLGSLEGGVLCR